MVFRIAGALCAAAMLSSGLAMMPASAAETTSAKIMGDLNGDLKVTMTDAKLALDLSVQANIGLVDKNVTEENDAADINMNGNLELMDAVAILNYYCQSMIGDQPMWSEIRKLTYHDGSEYDPYYVTPENKPDDYVGLPFAKRGMYVEIGCAEGKPGETVSVPVYVAGINEVVSICHFQNTPEGLKLKEIDSDLGISYVCGVDENGEPYGYDVEYDKSKCATSVANLENGAFCWMAAAAENIPLTDGLVIATYQYQIPETAKAGDTYVITVNPEKTVYACNEGETYRYTTFQYTLLNGVVAVK
jgi:hypothetical protein